MVLVLARKWERGEREEWAGASASGRVKPMGKGAWAKRKGRRREAEGRGGEGGWSQTGVDGVEWRERGGARWTLGCTSARRLMWIAVAGCTISGLWGDLQVDGILEQGAAPAVQQLIKNKRSETTVAVVMSERVV
jgi:hypothetical protein